MRHIPLCKSSNDLKSVGGKKKKTPSLCDCQRFLKTLSKTINTGQSESSSVQSATVSCASHSCDCCEVNMESNKLGVQNNNKKTTLHLEDVCLTLVYKETPQGILTNKEGDTIKINTQKMIYN